MSPKVCPNEFVRKLLQKIISFIIMLFSSKNSDIFAQNPNALLPKGMDQKQCCQLFNFFTENLKSAVFLPFRFYVKSKSILVDLNFRIPKSGIFGNFRDQEI